MKKQSTFLYVLRLALTLLLITSCMAAALAGVNMLTKDKIAAINREKTEKAIQEVITSPYESIKEIPFTDDTGLVKKVYTTWDDQEHPMPMFDCYCDYGFAVEVVPSGFDGEITMMVGVHQNGTVTGISIISHTETAGLGAVAAANNSKGEAFRNQFIGMRGSVSVSKDGGKIDAITGATITSRAVTEGVNAALRCIDNMR